MLSSVNYPSCSQSNRMQNAPFCTLLKSPLRPTPCAPISHSNTNPRFIHLNPLPWLCHHTSSIQVIDTYMCAIWKAQWCIPRSSHCPKTLLDQESSNHSSRLFSLHVRYTKPISPYPNYYVLCIFFGSWPTNPHLLQMWHGLTNSILSCPIISLCQLPPFPTPLS